MQTPTRTSDTLAPFESVQDFLGSALDREQDAVNDNTRAAYSSGWKAFQGFCGNHDLDPLPARPEAVVAFTEYLVETEGLTFNTVRTYLAAIRAVHLEQGAENPCDSRQVRNQVANLSRTMDVRPEKKKPILLKHLLTMDFRTDPAIRGIRDRALLFIGWTGALRRSELVSIEMKDIHGVQGGRRIDIPRSKTDQAGEGQHVFICDGPPNDALSAWLEAADISSGPVFRGVDRWGNVSEDGLSGTSVYRIVKRYMKQVLEQEGEHTHYSAHSLRSGFMSQGYRSKIGIKELMQQSRHRSEEVARGYQHAATTPENDPARRMWEEAIEERESTLQAA